MTESIGARGNQLPDFLQWTWLGRAIVFFLSATSIWCLLAEFYKLCSMRMFTFWVLIPSTLLLVVMAIVDWKRGDRRLFWAMVIGSIGGFIAACSYDTFRIPFVVAAIDHVGPIWLRLPLFKVFPRFGALILGQPFDANTTDSQFTLTAHLVGWIYHFSNGITFGIMYMALIGDAVKRSWLWAIALAVFLELAMLFTPYTQFFGIRQVTNFVIVTLTAHLIFGVGLGLYTRAKATRLAGAAPSF